MKENQNTSIRYWLDNVGTPSHVVLEYTKNRSVAFAEAINGIKNPLSEADIAEYYKKDPYTGVIATSLWLGKHRSIPREFSFLSGGEKNIRCQIRYWTKLLEEDGIRSAFYASAGFLYRRRKPKDVETSAIFTLPPWELLHFIGYNLQVNKRPPILDIEKHYSLLKEAHSDMLHQWYTKDNAGNIVVKDKSQMDYIYFDYCRRISKAFYEHPNGCIDYHPMQLDVYVITGRAEHHFLRDLVDISLELKKMGYAVWDDYSHHCFRIHKSLKPEDMSLRRHLIESAKCLLVYDHGRSLSSAVIHDLGVAIENGKPIIVVGEFDGVRLEKALNIKKKFPWVTVENWDMMMKHLVSICGKQPPVSAVKRVKGKSKLQHPDDPIPMQSKRTGKWGYCDKEGRSRCQYNYDKTYLFADGMGRVSIDGNYGYMGLNVREVIIPQYAHARDFCCGLAPVAYESRGPINKQKWGYIDKENNLIVPYDYDDADVFEPCGLARVRIGEKYGIIDTKGKLVIPVEYDNIIIEGIGHNAPGRIKKGGKYGYVNSKGEIIAAPLFDMANAFGEGLAVCKSGEQLFTIDITGNRLVGLDYDNAKCFSEGLLPVCLNHTDMKGKRKELWGFCDRNGNEVIPCEYDDVLPFSDCYAAVCYRGKWGFIDHKNRVMIPFQYDKMDGKELSCGYFGSFAEGVVGAVANGRDVMLNKFGQEFLSSDLIDHTPMCDRGWMTNWEILPYDYPSEAAILRRSGIWPEEYYITNILASLMQHRLKEHPEERRVGPTIKPKRGWRYNEE